MKRDHVRPAVAMLLLAAAIGPMIVTPASACGGVPCGYINPIITINVEGVSGKTFDTSVGQALRFTGSITYTFDASQEGFTAPNPGEEIVITFEFPRKPAWADIAVEPKSIDVPILPQYFETDSSDPQNVKMIYRFTSPLSIEVLERERPTLPPERPTVKATIFAKSSESGFYKSGYGLKQFKLKPIDAEYASIPDPLAGLNVKDYVGKDLPPVTRSFGTTSVSLQSTTPMNLWSPTGFEVTIADTRGDTSGATVIASLSTGSGELLHSTGSLEAVGGKVGFRLTFPESGLHVLSVASLPPPAGAVTWDPFVAVFEVPIGFDDSYVVPGKLYTATYREFPRAFSADAAGKYGQYERFIEIPVYDGIRTIEVGLTAGNTAPGAPGDASNGAGSYSAEIIDPQGKTIATQTFGAANPARALAVDAVPSTGVYLLHVYGTGLSRGATGGYYEANVRATYDEKNVFPPIPLASTADVGAASLGPVGLLVAPTVNAAWRPVPWKIGLSDASQGGDLLLTVSDPEGRIVHNSGLIVGVGAAETIVTLPAHGIFHASLLFLDQVRPQGPHRDAVLATLPVRVGSTETADDSFEGAYETMNKARVASSGPYERTMPLRLYPGVRSGIASVEVGGTGSFVLGAALIDASGRVVKGTELDQSKPRATFDLAGLSAGDYAIRLSGRSAATPANPIEIGAKTMVEYAEAVVIPNPLYERPLLPLENRPARTPGVETALMLLSIASVASLSRRRQAR
ncbi:MAG: hypothetical protein HY556_01025 [Euryarchaeota archaeon]|nr:hypothetical protein [Euryarchaeota archaeon]